MTQGVQFLRLPEVSRRVGLSRSTIYALVKAGDFPPWIKLTKKISAWPAHAVDAWIAGRMAAATNHPAMLKA